MLGVSQLLVRAAFLETEEGSGWRGMAASYCCVSGSDESA
jgi:hypothetical protein